MIDDAYKKATIKMGLKIGARQIIDFFMCVAWLVALICLFANHTYIGAIISFAIIGLLSIPRAFVDDANENEYRERREEEFNQFKKDVVEYFSSLEVECYECQQPTSKCMCKNERFIAARFIAQKQALIKERKRMNILLTDWAFKLEPLPGAYGILRDVKEVREEMLAELDKPQ